MTGWKTIRYRGGLVEFRIPQDWAEEYGDEGGGTFYEPTTDSDTLRLDVLTVRTRSPVGPQTVRELLRPRADKYDVPLVELPNGNALVFYSEPVQEDGVDLIVHYWELASSVPPDHARIGIFSFTTSAAPRPTVARDLEWLHREIRGAQFSADLGSVD